MADVKKQVESSRRMSLIMAALSGQKYAGPQYHDPETLSEMANQAGRLRYGMPTSEKEVIARQRSLPGAPEVDSDAEEADRYAAGYLFRKNRPRASKALQWLASRANVSDMPFFGGSKPELQSYADAGATAADSENVDTVRRARLLK